MNTIEYLSQAQLLYKRAMAKSEQLLYLRELARSASISYGGEVVSHSRNDCALQDAVIRVIQTEESVVELIGSYIDTMKEITALLDSVRNPEYRLILEQRYLCFHSWGKIASDLNISRSNVQAKHQRAVAVVEKLMKEKEAS